MCWILRQCSCMMPLSFVGSSIWCGVWPWRLLRTRLWKSWGWSKTTSGRSKRCWQAPTCSQCWISSAPLGRQSWGALSSQHRMLASLLWSWVVGLGKKPTRHVCQVPLMMLFVKQCSYQAKGGQAKLSMTLVLSCRSRTWRAWEMKAFLLRWKSIPSCHGCWIYIYTCLRNQPLRQLFLLALQQDWCATVLWIAWRWCARSRGDWSSTLKESPSHRCTWSNIRQARLFCPAGLKHTSPMTSPPKSDWMRVTCRIFHQVLPFDVAQSFFGPRTSLH